MPNNGYDPAKDILVTLEMMNEKLPSAINKINEFSTLMGVYFQILFDTGCRAAEPLDISKWEDLGGGVFKLETLKTQEERIILAAELPEIFRSAISNQIELFENHSYEYLLRNYKKYSELARAKIGSDNIQLHIFRHRKARQLKEDGKTELEIQNYFAWRKIGMVLQYTQTPIYIPPPSLVTPKKTYLPWWEKSRNQPLL